LCLLMVAVMCMSFFGASASALSFNISGASGSSTGSISIPITVSEDDESGVSSTPAPKSTPALDEGFGAGEPDEVDDEAFEADMDLDKGNSEAVDTIAKAIEGGQTVIKFNGYFSFEDTTLEITKNVTFSISSGTMIEYMDNVVVKKGGTLSITGSGIIDELPTVEAGGKLLIYGGIFGDGVDPTAYVAEGYEAKLVDGSYYQVSKKTVTVEEPEDEDEPEKEDPSLYLNANGSDKAIKLNSYEYEKNSNAVITATFDTSASAAGNLAYFFMVKSSSTVIGDENLLSTASYSINYVGDTATLTIRNSYLDGLDADEYWFVGVGYNETTKGPDLTCVKYSEETLEIQRQNVPSAGTGEGGLKVSVFEKQYTDNGGWETGDGALHFYCRRTTEVIDLEIIQIEIDDLDHSASYVLDNEMWYDQGGGYFFVGESQFLNRLSKGVHTIKVTAKDIYGNVFRGTCDFVVLQDPSPVLEFVGTYKHVINSGKSLKLKCSEPIAAVFVGKNGTQLDNYAFQMYKLSNDGKTLTLTSEFLNQRAAGYTYSIWVKDASGNESNELYFQILTTAQANASVDTGDASDIALWAAFLILSGAAIAVALPRVKKNGGKE
ncbi:MAG: hypothetical protein ACI3XQ_09320, partial [Eubacteriales bacterium]